METLRPIAAVSPDLKFGGAMLIDQYFAAGLRQGRQPVAI